MTNAELRKELVAELNSKKPNAEKVAILQNQIDEMDAKAANIKPVVFGAEYGEPEEMEECYQPRS